MNTTRLGLLGLVLLATMGCAAPEEDAVDAQGDAVTQGAPFDVEASTNTLLGDLQWSESLTAEDQTQWRVIGMSGLDGRGVRLVVSAAGNYGEKIWDLGAFDALNERPWLIERGDHATIALSMLRRTDDIEAEEVSYRLKYGASGEQLDEALVLDEVVVAEDGSETVVSSRKIAASRDRQVTALQGLVAIGDPVMLGQTEARQVLVSSNDQAKSSAVHLALRSDGKPGRAFNLNIRMENVNAMEAEGEKLRIRGTARLQASGGGPSTVVTDNYIVEVGASRERVTVTRVFE